MAAQLISVNFHDQSLTATLHKGKPYVALKPICENIGLHWRGQLERIKRHSVLNSVVRMTRTTSLGQDGKTYNVEMIMLPLNYLNGWLFSVDAARVKPELKDRLIAYQRECFEVLADYFWPQTHGLAALPEVQTITRAQQGELFTMVANKARSVNKPNAYFWARFQNHFKVSSYKLLPADKFGEAMDYLRRLEGNEGDSFMMLTPQELSGIVRENIESYERKRIANDCPQYRYPLTDWKPENRVGATGWLTYRELNRVESHQRPLSRLLFQLTQDGHDVAAASAEYRAILLLLECMHGKLESMRVIFNLLDERGLNVNFS
jgi:hypothetical protein